MKRGGLLQSRGMKVDSIKIDLSSREVPENKILIDYHACGSFTM